MILNDHLYNVHKMYVGLDGAGKTTALYMMKLDQFLNTVPTIGFNCERVKVRKYSLEMHI